MNVYDEKDGAALDIRLTTSDPNLLNATDLFAILLVATAPS